MQFSQVKKQVVERKEKSSLHGNIKMIGAREPHWQTASQAPDKKNQSGQSKTIGDRERRLNVAKLKLDSQPGGTPYQHRDGIKKKICHCSPCGLIELLICKLPEPVYGNFDGRRPGCRIQTNTVAILAVDGEDRARSDGNAISLGFFIKQD